MLDKHVIRAVLSDDVMDAVQNAEDVNEAFALMNAATDYYIAEDKPMPLADALAAIKKIAEKLPG